MHGQNHGGKGSAQRISNQERFNNNFDAIFGKKKETQPEGHCARCDASRYEGEFYVREERESYDMGDQTVWETYEFKCCHVCDEELDPNE